MKKYMIEAQGKIVLFICFFCSSQLVFSQGKLINENTASKKRAIALEMQKTLDNEFNCWYPQSLDTVYGGFFSDFNYKWELDGPQNKMIVTQARHIWSVSNAALFYKHKKHLADIGKHGVEFLKNKMWDKEFGGFYNLVTREGKPLEEGGRLLKNAYGNAFAIYGLAAYIKVTGDTTALNLAKQTFYWLEKHSYDPQYGGYYQFLLRDGTPLKDGYKTQPRFNVFSLQDSIWNPPKDQNSSIHLLECFTELYSVWPDPLLKKRLEQILHIIRDIITTENGYLNLFFSRDWTSVSFRNSSDAVRERNYYFDHVSFGHDIETAYLLLEASEVLGLKNDKITLRIAKKMVDHSLQFGWDKQNGGLFDGGYYFAGKTSPEIIRRTKEWWPQVETLNSCLMMADIFPNDPANYYKYFQRQWLYCIKYVIDTTRGGWYWSGTDAEPQAVSSAKGSIWKGNYHTSRALINCIRRLEKNERNE